MNKGVKKEGRGRTAPDRQERIQMIYSLVVYGLCLGALCYPWIMLGEKRYTLFFFARSIKAEGVDAVLARAGVTPDTSYEGGINVSLLLYLIFAVCCLCYVVTVLIRKDWYMNVLALVAGISLTYTGMSDAMLGSVCSNQTEATLYPGLLMVLTAAEWIGRKVIENWDTTVSETKVHEEKELREKEERRRRLYFPGKYKKLFYHVIWKNFRGNLKDYVVLLVCNGLVFAFAFTGFGLQKLTEVGGNSYRPGYPSGAGKILVRSLIELGAVGIFMLVLLLLYYLKKRIPEYGVFKTLGIRRKTMYLCMGLELGIGALLSIVLGGLVGTGLVILFRENMSGIGDTWFSAGLLLKSVGIMLVLYVATFFVTHDLFVGFRMGNSTDLQVMKEKMPGRFHALFVAAGAVLMGAVFWLYRQNSNFENLWYLIGGFAGVYIILRFGTAGFLLRGRKRGGVLKRLLKEHPFYHKSRSAVWYMFGLCVIQVCILAVFSLQLYSTALEQDVDALLPYDLVLLADGEEADGRLIEKLKASEGLEVTEYPMFRVSGSDATEKMESIEQDPVRSQNIGIPESAYHSLKRERNSSYQEKPLGLDDAGEKIYVVHQQDRSTKAQPIDYKSFRTTPYLYTGPVCEMIDVFAHDTAFMNREIIGEERQSLIGVLSHGERENLVVFSDTAFEQAKDVWKTTDPFYGKVIKPEELEDFAGELYRGPSKLVLVKGAVEQIEGLEAELGDFRERHRKDEEYDAKVKSCYLKSASRQQLETEFGMQDAMARMLIAVFFAASGLLLGIKMMTERKMNVRRAEFLSCMGMRNKERLRLLHGEMKVYYLIVSAVSAVFSAMLLAATFSARLYSAADIKALLIKIVPFGIGELLLFGGMVWLLTEINIRQIEKKIREV